mgnify:FL=1
MSILWCLNDLFALFTERAASVFVKRRRWLLLSAEAFLRNTDRQGFFHELRRFGRSVESFLRIGRAYFLHHGDQRRAVVSSAALPVVSLGVCGFLVVSGGAVVSAGVFAVVSGIVVSSVVVSGGFSCSSQ